MTADIPHWTDVLTLRDEVVDTGGRVGELQMSLHKAVYQTVDVPYRRVSYFADITQPTPNLVGFFARVANRLGNAESNDALYHLHQGMGGGKSHALVGLFHMANDPKAFFATDLGQAVRAGAENISNNGALDLDGTVVVALTADHFSPGRTHEVFGPATSLFERFIWKLVSGDMDRYQRYVAMGPDKATMQRALSDARRPVLILLDELMDYVQALSDKDVLGTMPREKGFLNALIDACDDVPQVACVIVMIRSDLDEHGYSVEAEDFRQYIAARLERHPGSSVAVTESADFSAILRRRLFETSGAVIPAEELALYYQDAGPGWNEVLERYGRLGPSRAVDNLAARITDSYPFQPELMRLVSDEWSATQGFQRVRSTVAIFSQTALHWTREHQEGRWAPALVGVGDLPLRTVLEPVLSSGLLLGNERAVQGFRAVVQNDITTADGSGGRAVALDDEARTAGVDASQPSPAERMATAIFMYSLVGRSQAKRGATKDELLVSLMDPGSRPTFSSADEIFNLLMAENGLGALEAIRPPNAPARFYLSIKQTLRMFFNAALAQISAEAVDELLWSQARALTTKGPFDAVKFVERGADGDALSAVFAEVDEQSTRLVVLDPRRWTLLNGRDSVSREEISSLLGAGQAPLLMSNGASCVIACVNTQRRDIARRRAKEVLAWRQVVRQITDDSEDELREAGAALTDAEAKLRQDIKRAYQHYSFQMRDAHDQIVVDFRRFDDNDQTSLSGSNVWAQLVTGGRAVSAGGLGASYLSALLDQRARDLTPKELFPAFYSDPSFPLVTGVDEVQRAVFELVGGDWELVDSHGQRIEVRSAGQIPPNSLQMTLRRRVKVQPPVNPADEVPAVTDSHGGESSAGGGSALGSGDHSLDETAKSRPTAVAYKRYRVKLDSRSITSDDSREKVWQLLREFASRIDPAGPVADHQMVKVDIELTTGDGQQGAIRERAESLGAVYTEQDDDF